MSTQLAHSMFQDVLFPPETEETDQDSSLRLRQLKRFVPEPHWPLTETPLIIFDLETTGLDPKTDRIIEIGAQKLVGFEVVDEFSTLVSTQFELTPDVVKLTGITPDMLEGQPSIDDVLPRFLQFIDGGILVAHNAEFDLSMIRAACSRMNVDLEWPCFCTVKMARELLPDLVNKKLDTLAEHYDLTFESRHRSIGDVKVTAGVLQALLEREGTHLRQWSDMSQFVVT